MIEHKGTNKKLVKWLYDNFLNVDEVNNKTFGIDNVSWGDLNEIKYKKIENKINDFIIETDYFCLYLWCDGSGYEYWMKREEENYCQLTLVLKKRLNKTILNELKFEIIKAVRYMEDNIENYVDFNYEKDENN